MKYAILFCVALISTPLQSQWVQSNLNCNMGRSLYSNGTTVFAASSQGVYYTSGAGDPWFGIGPAGKDIFCVTSVGTKIIAGSGASDGVFISTNNGVAWYQPSTFSSLSVRAFAQGSAYLFAGTWGGGVWRSSDSGESWEPAGLSGKGITEVYVVGSAVFAGAPDAYSKIYVSTNNGNTWGNSSLSYPASNFRSLFYDGSTLFACDFGLWASTDMGATWNLRYGVTFDSTGYATDIKLFRTIVKQNNLLVASIDFESVYTSSDGGYHWTPFNDGIVSDWTFVDIAMNGQYLWGLRDFFGNAYRRPVTDLQTGVEENVRHPVEGLLEQNYPNPFNPSTTIRYGLPNRADVTLSVFNTLGQQVALFENGQQEAGYHEVKFDGSGLASGVYFYRIQAGGFVQTRKLTILR
jgi:hypothetical protein